ncbi:MAG: hypothetical protein H6983_21335 [Ectothiorhodospiraceae bacterium]|nr:hypothetical protein [Chromatiales bacterium]MCP5156733.1 hypothetical protein [Ectothiorhodospiraceae bacterium]
MAREALGRAAEDGPVPNGTRRTVDDKECVYYDGYWIRHYAPPRETLAAKKRLIEHLSRRLFHHTEVGINTPGENLERARKAYEREQDPARKRVAGAMLAGALFNRATDIFTTLVDLQQKGVEISPSNELMRQCEQYFQEALALGKSVKHYSGHEGIDELWGEPLKAFVMPLKDFYESRYIKIAQTMRDIDRVAGRLRALLASERGFAGIDPLIREFADAAKLESETMRSDPVIFVVWPRFVAAGEALVAFRPSLAPGAPEHLRRRAEGMLALLRDGKDLLTYLSGARVPMPKSTREYLERCDAQARAVYPQAASLPPADPGG